MFSFETLWLSIGFQLPGGIYPTLQLLIAGVRQELCLQSTETLYGYHTTSLEWVLDPGGTDIEEVEYIADVEKECSSLGIKKRQTTGCF